MTEGLRVSQSSTLPVFHIDRQGVHWVRPYVAPAPTLGRPRVHTQAADWKADPLLPDGRRWGLATVPSCRRGRGPLNRSVRVTCRRSCSGSGRTLGVPTLSPATSTSVSITRAASLWIQPSALRQAAMGLPALRALFADGALPVQGLDLYRRNLSLLVPFLDNPSIDLLDLRRLDGGSPGGTEVLEASWRLRTGEAALQVARPGRCGGKLL